LGVVFSLRSSGIVSAGSTTVDALASWYEDGGKFNKGTSDFRYQITSLYGIALLQCRDMNSGNMDSPFAPFGFAALLPDLGPQDWR
jgi:hypothetical protein